MTTLRRLVALVALLASATLLVVAPAAAEDAAEREDGRARQLATTSLPPGNSHLFTLDGFARQQVTGVPGDGGPFTDDQREDYWAYRNKDARFVPSADACPTTTPVGNGELAAGVETLRDGAVRICWSDRGVPAVFADTAADLWYGSAWVQAKLRLFLLDSIRRTARGTLAEIAGVGSLEADVATRYQAYSEAEYQRQLEDLQPAAREAIRSYVQGVNDWIAFVQSPQGARLLPAEYAVLTVLPEPITETDVVAVGVLMTRFVASEGKREMQWVRALRAMEATFGVDEGRARFLDLVWDADAEAHTTVLASEGVFPRTDATAAQRRAAFDELASFAATIPHDLDDGPGTDLEQRGAIPADEGGGDGPGPGDLPVGPGDLPVPANPAAVAAAALREWTEDLTGGSWQVMLAPSRTADGSTLLVSEPQLGYSPVLLVELQLTGGGYDVRGVTVPGLPVVGIGYTPSVAWSLTTGNSKTIDTFVETLRPDTNEDGAPEHLHDGTWKDLDCRTESFAAREAPEGVPVGPAIPRDDHVVCTTVHGPLVSPAVEDITEQGQLGLSYQWHMAGREVRTIDGVLRWNRATSAADMLASIPDLTWNENVGWADASGRIGWWHPGVHLEKAQGADLRLPLPGTGAYDNGDPLPIEALPHVVDPPRGFITNWNNKPGKGWLDGEGKSETSLPASRYDRGRALFEVVAARDDWTFDALVTLDREASSVDFRRDALLPALLALRDRPDLTATEQAALAALAAWDGSANGPGADMAFAGFAADPPATTIGPAASVFERFTTELRADVLADDRPGPYTVDGEAFVFDLVERQTAKGRHHYDTDAALALVVRALDPSTSSVGTAVDYLDGRTPEQVVRSVFATTVAGLQAELGDDVTAWRTAYPSSRVCSATGVMGPCGVMPFVERGTWVHHVGWTPAATTGGPGPVPDPAPDVEPEQPLPSTGGGTALLATVLLAAGAALRRPRRGAPAARGRA